MRRAYGASTISHGPEPTPPPGHTVMQILPIDLTSLVATILGISIVLVPVIGITARFALKPTVEALSRLFEHRGLDDTVHILERRIELQEHQIDALEATVRRLGEVTDFNRELLAPKPGGATSAPDSSTPTS